MLGKSFIFLNLLIVFLHCFFRKIENSLSPQPFPYQAHSFNDLGIVRHLLRKGVKYWKFDGSIVSKQSCRSFSTSNLNSCFNSTKYVQQLCCIAMRGDGSPQPSYYYPFNTSNEFIAVFQEYLSQFHSKIQFLMVAIDIQFPFEWENIVAQQFFLQLKRLMDKYSKLHVTVGTSYILQFDHACRKIGINQTNNIVNNQNQLCTNKRKQISDGRFFLQSSSLNPYDSRNYKNRFKNFNIIFRQIDKLCQNGFPTWQNKYPQFPLIFWQPSNDLNIQQSLQKLLSPSCRAKHNRTINGIAFATNLQPEMFLLGMKELNGDSFPWNLDNNKIFLNKAMIVKMVKIIQNNIEKLVIYWQQQANNTIFSRFSPIKYLGICKLNELTGVVSLQNKIKLNYNVFDLKSINNIIIAIAKQQSSTIIVGFNSQLIQTSKYQTSNIISSYATSQYLYFISLTSNPNIINLYYIDNSLKKQTQYGSSIYLGAQKILSINSMYFNKRNTFTQDLFFIAGNNYKQAWIMQIKNNQQYIFKNITYGINPKFYQKQNGKIYIIVQNSYAHGGTLINHSGQNKCMFHRYPKLIEMATVKYLTNSIEAKIQDFVNFLTSQNQIITGCHPKICFTRILNGEKTQTVFIWGRQIVSTKYIHVTQQDFMGVIFSGGSNYEVDYRQKSGFIIGSIRAQNQVFDFKKI